MQWLLSLQQAYSQSQSAELLYERGLYALLSGNLGQQLSLCSSLSERVYSYLSCYLLHQVVKRVLFIRHVYPIQSLGDCLVDYSQPLLSLYTGLFGSFDSSTQDDLTVYLSQLEGQLAISSAPPLQQLHFAMLKYHFNMLSTQEA